MHRRNVLQYAGTIAAASLGIPNANAQPKETWPGERPVRVIVPYPPGGTVDFAGRQIGVELGKLTNGTFIVENRAGASGMIGTSNAATSPGDGHTILALDSSYAMRPSTIRNIPYDSNDAFAPVTGLFQSPFVLVVSAESPFKTAGDFIEHARKNPGQLKFGSGGIGTATHLPFELLMSRGNFKLQHIPYKGGGEVIIGLMGGQVDCFISSVPGIISHLQGKKVRALAQAGVTPNPAIPDVPLFSQAGVSDFNVMEWIGIALPKSSPAALVSSVHAAVEQAVKSQTFSASISQRGAVPMLMQPSQFQEFIRNQTDIWNRVSAAAGIVPV